MPLEYVQMVVEQPARDVELVAELSLEPGMLVKITIFFFTFQLLLLEELVPCTPAGIMLPELLGHLRVLAAVHVTLAWLGMPATTSAATTSAPACRILAHVLGLCVALCAVVVVVEHYANGNPAGDIITG